MAGQQVWAPFFFIGTCLPEKEVSMPHQDRMARLHLVQRLLSASPHGLQADEIAEHCEVSRRTAYRDLVALQDAKVPVWNDGGRWFLDRSQYLPPIKLTLDEATALFIASRLANRYADERSRALESAFEKLAGALPAPISSHVLATVRAMKDRPVDTTFDQVLTIITQAWAEGRTVRLWYRSAADDGPRERRVDPYFIEPSAAGRSIYVIGRDHDADEMRTFKVERITAIETTDERFVIPDDFEPDAYLRGRWGIGFGDEVEVRLRFGPAVARRLQETIWHPSQQLTEDSSGAVCMRLRIAGLIEITPWVLSWGDQVEVLEPPELRESIAATARALAQRYA
jgi:proteasome accessory factor B